MSLRHPVHDLVYRALKSVCKYSFLFKVSTIKRGLVCESLFVNKRLICMSLFRKRGLFCMSLLAI